MDLIIRPIVTEKMTTQTELFNRYGFIVSRFANKIDITPCEGLQPMKSNCS